MNFMQLQRKKKDAPSGAPDKLTDTVRRETAWAVGTEYFQNRDPLYHVTENFQQTFDAIGRRHAAGLSAQEHAGEQPVSAEKQPEDASFRSFYERKTPEEQRMLQRFSETAFQRGTMSAAVLQGSGQMMLFSCLKKTIGQSQPNKWQQRKLFEKASPGRNAPGHNPDKVFFNRGFTDSAVGLVIDTLRDARRTVETMQSLAQGKSEMGTAGGDTLQTMYPFLSDGRERALLSQYRASLEKAKSPGESAALQNAISRLEALVAKKAQMKQEFINKLRFISDRAAEALTAFSEPGFSGRLDESLRQALGAEKPDENEADQDGAADTDKDGGQDGEDPNGREDPKI